MLHVYLFLFNALQSVGNQEDRRLNVIGHESKDGVIKQAKARGQRRELLSEGRRTNIGTLE
jgi:hypothetical protein